MVRRFPAIQSRNLAAFGNSHPNTPDSLSDGVPCGSIFFVRGQENIRHPAGCKPEFPPRAAHSDAAVDTPFPTAACRSARHVASMDLMTKARAQVQASASLRARPIGPILIAGAGTLLAIALR